MRISDWSSDVCSSDLRQPARIQRQRAQLRAEAGGGEQLRVRAGARRGFGLEAPLFGALLFRPEGRGRGARRGVLADERPAPEIQSGGRQIGRASCRERVWQYVWI